MKIRLVCLDEEMLGTEIWLGLLFVLFSPTERPSKIVGCGRGLPMFFSVDSATVRWIQKNLSRARTSGNWQGLVAREECWVPAVFAALVDEHDRLQLEGATATALEIGQELPRLASRIRPEAAGGELSRRSLEVWALAVLGSSQRAAGRPTEAQSSFEAGFAKGKAGIYRWTAGELERRFARHLLQEFDRRALAAVERALACFGDHPDQQAECLNLRGACRDVLCADPSGAIQDFGLAASISDPRRSTRSGWSFHAALLNLALELVKGGPCTLESLGQARKLLVASREFLGKGVDPRKARTLWVEGLLVYRIGWNRHGERLLDKARQSFRKLGSTLEFALTTLDLALMLVGDGEAERAGNLFREVDGVLSVHPETSLVAAHLGSLDLEQAPRARHEIVAALARSPRHR